MSQAPGKDWIPKLQARYAGRGREGKSRRLDELCQDSEYERKYAIYTDILNDFRSWWHPSARFTGRCGRPGRTSFCPV